MGRAHWPKRNVCFVPAGDNTRCACNGYFVWRWVGPVYYDTNMCDGCFELRLGWICKVFTGTEPTEAIVCSSTKVGVPHLECDDTKCEAWPDRHRLALPVHLRVGLVHLHQLHQVPLQLLEQAVFHVAQAVLAFSLDLLVLVFGILEVEACVVSIRDS